MEHDFWIRSSGKFPGATEHLKRLTCFSGRNFPNERYFYDRTLLQYNHNSTNGTKCWLLLNIKCRYVWACWPWQWETHFLVIYRKSSLPSGWGGGGGVFYLNHIGGGGGGGAVFFCAPWGGGGGGGGLNRDRPGASEGFIQFTKDGGISSPKGLERRVEKHK